MKKSKFILFVSAVLFCLSVASPAYAYLDPGTGSMLLQLMLGGFAGLLVVGKLYFHKFASLFGLTNDADELEFAEDEEKAASKNE
ncbi:MAG: hypothetical protein V7723_14975 [Sneathiella sp.]|uniref:hypothetical protein n=1 Tax=Sneathiella sp. TaxID=1964365 RepID=UPI003002B0F6